MSGNRLTVPSDRPGLTVPTLTRALLLLLYFQFQTTAHEKDLYSSSLNCFVWNG